MSTTSGDLGLERFDLSTDQADEVRMAVVEVCVNVVAAAGGAGREAEVVLEAVGPKDTPRGLQITVRGPGDEETANARGWRHSLVISR